MTPRRPRIQAAARLLLAVTAPLSAQDGDPIFPGLEGQALLDSLVAAYRPNDVLSYADARDQLFGDIDNRGDSLTGVYSGYTIYMDPTADPSTWAYEHGINTEHTWPQSKGASGQAKSDMHHLFPTRSSVNSSRGNLPFGESPDAETDRWWRLDDDQTWIPDSHIDEYAETRYEIAFEPREEHKGNAARAMFYFYTMYRQQADDADPTFFGRQKETLLAWHEQDPADETELQRSERIALFQSGKPNPFVLDATLVQRAYFAETGIAGEGGVPEPAARLKLSLAPNPFNPLVTIAYELNVASAVELAVYDLRGQRVETLQPRARRAAGRHRLQWNARGRASGIYLCRLTTGDGAVVTRRMVLLK
jgi:endonuclease I